MEVQTQESYCTRRERRRINPLLSMSRLAGQQLHSMRQNIDNSVQ